MRTPTRLVAATAAVGLATTMGIGTAFAAPSGHIVSADSGNGKITVVFGGVGGAGSEHRLPDDPQLLR